MAESRLTVESARAWDLAHELARREQRTVTEIVERALEEYAARQVVRQPASTFYLELNRRYATDLDLES